MRLIGGKQKKNVKQNAHGCQFGTDDDDVVHDVGRMDGILKCSVCPFACNALDMNDASVRWLTCAQLSSGTTNVCTHLGDHET